MYKNSSLDVKNSFVGVKKLPCDIRKIIYYYISPDFTLWKKKDIITFLKSIKPSDDTSNWVFKNLDLSKSDFSNIIFKNIILWNVNFEKCKFYNSKFFNIDAKGCDFSEARFEKTIMYNVNLSNVKLIKSIISHCYFYRTDFTGSNMNNSTVKISYIDGKENNKKFKFDNTINKNKLKLIIDDINNNVAIENLEN